MSAGREKANVNSDSRGGCLESGRFVEQARDPPRAIQTSRGCRQVSASSERKTTIVIDEEARRGKRRLFNELSSQGNFWVKVVHAMFDNPSSVIMLTTVLTEIESGQVVLWNQPE
jgi:hypothetical protein